LHLGLAVAWQVSRNTSECDGGHLVKDDATYRCLSASSNATLNIQVGHPLPVPCRFRTSPCMPLLLPDAPVPLARVPRQRLH
jgi:hypothetical protein